MNTKTKKGILGQAHQTWLETPGGRRGFQLRGTRVAMEGSGHELLLRHDVVELCQSGLAPHLTKLNDLAHWLARSLWRGEAILEAPCRRGKQGSVWTHNEAKH